MELILALVLAGPLGYFARSRKLALALYLLGWAIVFPIQTIAVHAENPDDTGAAYLVVNALILAGGVGLTRLGDKIARSRKRARSEAG
jgi:hypothetical protein